ncbi:hypothetical protein KFU94_34300 [Chloroflexi bacterium TSY]|nr:hypothetical protein [Chloroflexi bacterium TSY]
MKSKALLRVVSVLVISTIVLYSQSNVTQAAEWHHPNGIAWTVGKVCRDGALLMQTHQFALDNPAWNPPISFEIELQANLYLGPDVTGIVSQLELPDEGLFGDVLGDATMSLTTKTTPLLVTGAGEAGTQVTFVYDVQILEWNLLEVDETVLIAYYHANGSINNHGYFLAAVEDCYILPDAMTKSPSLGFSASVSHSQSACGTESSITTSPGHAIYACLILENTGDVTFTSHKVQNSEQLLGASFPLTITPGTRISITQEIATAAGLAIDLGPFTDGNDQEITFTWQAVGVQKPDVEVAIVNIDRFGLVAPATSTMTSTPAPTSTSTLTPTPTSTKASQKIATPTMTATSKPRAISIESVYLPLLVGQSP